MNNHEREEQLFKKISSLVKNAKQIEPFSINPKLILTFSFFIIGVGFGYFSNNFSDSNFDYTYSAFYSPYYETDFIGGTNGN